MHCTLHILCIEHSRSDELHLLCRCYVLHALHVEYIMNCTYSAGIMHNTLQILCIIHCRSFLNCLTYTIFTLNTVKPVFSDQTKEDQVMFSRPIIAKCRSKVLQNAPVEHSAVLSTCVKIPNGFQTFVLTSLQWPLKTGSTVLEQLVRHKQL